VNFFRLTSALVLLSPLLGHAASDVTVVVDMTPAGRSAVHPTPEHPAYYLPVMRGYHELGDVVAGERYVSPHDIVRVLAPELFRQGYRVIEESHQTPDLIIDISWGYITPTAGNDTYNQNQRYALTLGKSIFNVIMPESFGNREFMEAAREPRYFLVVTAYDYATWSKKQKHLILWKAKMSVPTRGVFFNDVLFSLVQAGGPMFGHETINHPKLMPLPEGQVDVGTPTVREGDTSRPVVPSSPDASHK
jgi:hypothetical protein